MVTENKGKKRDSAMANKLKSSESVNFFLHVGTSRLEVSKGAHRGLLTTGVTPHRLALLVALNARLSLVFFRRFLARKSVGKVATTSFVETCLYHSLGVSVRLELLQVLPERRLKRQTTSHTCGSFRRAGLDLINLSWVARARVSHA